MSALRRGSCLVLLGVVFSGAVLANVVVGSRVQFRQFFTLGQNGRVTIENQYGNVSIVAWDRDDVLVEAVKQTNDPRRMDDARIVVEPSEGMLAIHTQYAGSNALNPAKVEYRISVPRSTNLEDVKLGNGGLTISGVAGPVKASSVNGNIRAEKLEGRAELSTVNGELEANFQRVKPAEQIVLRSVNGPIRLMLPCGAKASLSAHNVSGGILSDFGHPSRVDGEQKLEVRGGGARIRLDNVNGGISIHSGPIHSAWSRRGGTL